MNATNTIREFVNNLLLDDDFVRVYVRLPITYACFANHAVRQIRTTKHDADAFGLDCLGNVSVLWADGRRQQLIGDEIKAAGLFR